MYDPFDGTSPDWQRYRRLRLTWLAVVAICLAALFVLPRYWWLAPLLAVYLATLVFSYARCPMCRGRTGVKPGRTDLSYSPSGIVGFRCASCGRRLLSPNLRADNGA